MVGMFLFTPNDKKENPRNGFLMWNDTTNSFDIITIFERNTAVNPEGEVGGARQAQVIHQDGIDYVYLFRPFAFLRCKVCTFPTILLFLKIRWN